MSAQTGSQTASFDFEFVGEIGRMIGDILFHSLRDDPDHDPFHRLLREGFFGAAVDLGSDRGWCCPPETTWDYRRMEHHLLDGVMIARDIVGEQEEACWMRAAVEHHRAQLVFALFPDLLADSLRQLQTDFSTGIGIEEARASAVVKRVIQTKKITWPHREVLIDAERWRRAVEALAAQHLNVSLTGCWLDETVDPVASALGLQGRSAGEVHGPTVSDADFNAHHKLEGDRMDLVRVAGALEWERVLTAAGVGLQSAPRDPAREATARTIITSQRQRIDQLAPVLPRNRYVSPPEMAALIAGIP